MVDNKNTNLSKDMPFNSKLDDKSILRNLKDLVDKIKNLKPPEQLNRYKNYENIIPSIKNDNKMNALLIRTYYLNEFEKIEQYINSKELLYNSKYYELNSDEYKELISIINKLLNIINLSLNKEDYLKSLLIQNKIVNMLKSYIIEKIGNLKYHK